VNSRDENADTPAMPDTTAPANPGSGRRGAPDRAAARQVALAVAEREQGRRRLNATTVTVTCASVVAAGVVAAMLPGSSHAAVTKTGSSSSAGSSGSGSTPNGSSDGSSSNSAGDQGGLQPPANPPQVVIGSGGSTSGGT
jgi:hypothetical protein